MARVSATTLTPLTTLDAAVPPNLASRSLELAAMSSSEVPAAPKCSATEREACRSEDTIWEPVWKSAATTT